MTPDFTRERSGVWRWRYPATAVGETTTPYVLAVRAASGLVELGAVRTWKASVDGHRALSSASDQHEVARRGSCSSIAACSDGRPRTIHTGV